MTVPASGITYKLHNMTSEPYKGTDKLLFGIILGVLAFWLFAQTTLNINVDMAKELQMEASMMNIAVSITSLFSGIFIVVLGGLADHVGRLKIIKLGFVFSIIGSLLVGLTPAGPSNTCTGQRTNLPGIVCSLHYACEPGFIESILGRCRAPEGH
jgi:MFS family permease